MIFTGVVLVAAKYSNGCFENYAGIQGFKTCVVNKITSLFHKEELKNKKINDLTNKFTSISVGVNPSNYQIDQLCEYCKKVNEIITQNPLSSIDIMNIFFTEFNRYRGKSEHGQVFTPDHIADLMANLLDIKENDVVLDPTCGSGSLLVKAHNLLAKVTNPNKNPWENIYGNDFDQNILFLAYINMLLHNDGITNLVQYNCVSDKKFNEWVKEKKITKVIANPPYEKSNAINILDEVLKSVEPGCRVCWLMPNTKMDKIKKSKLLLKKHSLTDIILLPDVFAKVGCGTVSLFMYTAKIPHDNKPIKCWSILDDGFETVKNQGRQDTKHKWQKIKEEFLDKWESDKCDFEINPNDCLSYPRDIKSKEVTKEDFTITLLQYMLFKQGNISQKDTVASTLKLLLKFMDINNLDDKLEFLKEISRSKNEK